jgi:hypothetical protein
VQQWQEPCQLSDVLVLLQIMRGVFMGGFEAAKAGLESGDLDEGNVKCFTRYSGWYVFSCVCGSSISAVQQVRWQADRWVTMPCAGAQGSWRVSAKQASGSLRQHPAASCCSRGRMAKPCGIRYVPMGTCLLSLCRR